MKNKKNFLKKSALLTTVALLPFIASCTQINIHSDFYPKTMSQEEYQKKANALASRTSSPFFHFGESRLLNEAFEMMLNTEEGREVFERAPTNLNLKSLNFSPEDRKNDIAMLAVDNFVYVDSDIIETENIGGLAMMLAHDIEHHNQPDFPDNLTFDQYATLYKLREIDGLLTEMQVATECGLDQFPSLPEPYHLYGKMYHRNCDKYLKKGVREEKAKRWAKQETKAYFFKAYLNDDEPFIDPEWKQAYEDRLLKSILSESVKIRNNSFSDYESDEIYFKSLDFYLEKCGKFLNKWDINRSGISASNVEATLVKEAIDLYDLLKNDPELKKSTLQDYYNYLKQDLKNEESTSQCQDNNVNFLLLSQKNQHSRH